MGGLGFLSGRVRIQLFINVQFFQSRSGGNTLVVVNDPKFNFMTPPYFLFYKSVYPPSRDTPKKLLVPACNVKCTLWGLRSARHWNDELQL